MKKILICALLASAFTLVGAELKFPAHRMSEPELLAVLKENGLNDKVTACQELAHKGSDASLATLAALLTDQTPAPLFLAAQNALQNFPQPAAGDILKKAIGTTVKDAARIKGLQTTLRLRETPVSPDYTGAAAIITAFPPPNAIQKGDLSVIPGLVEQALGTGFEAQHAQRMLVGFPNAGVENAMLALVTGTDMKKAKLGIGVLGQRRARSDIGKLLEVARTTKDASLRGEIFKAFATLCDGRDLAQLLAQLKDTPTEDRLIGSLIRVYSRELRSDADQIAILKADYSPDPQPSDKGKTPGADVTRMVKALVAGGLRTVPVTNHLAGDGGFARDPAPGRVKFLRMQYRLGNGPVLSAIARETTEFTFGEISLPEAYAKPLVAALASAQGAYRDALLQIVTALEKRGVVPGVETVLFRPIFNGKDLTGWTQQDGYFSVKDGVILGASTKEHMCKPNHHIVYTAEKLGDFELRAEFKLSRGANSGIQLRCLPQFIGDNGYQADMNGGGDYVGYIYNPKLGLIGERGADITINADGKKSVERFADNQELRKLYKTEAWNDMRVKVEGRTITVWVNGVRMTSVTDQRKDFLPDQGQIALQLHQGPEMTVEFRNLRIRTK